MKTFQDDNPLLRYAILFVGSIIGSFVGAISGVLLFGVIFKG
jgi:hypothetical protein